MSGSVRERPILFSAEMVRAILDGRKSQTRRVMKPQPHLGRYGETHPTKPSGVIADDYFVWESIPVTPGCMYRLIPCCPYGQPGDRLWVRETWGVIYGRCQSPLCRLSGCMFPQACPRDDRKAVYRADGVSYSSIARWSASIHMPRWASRITLEITGVRVERVQDISEADAIAEGCRWYSDVVDARSEYRARWILLNERRGYGWDANPWVWVIEFKRLAPHDKTAVADLGDRS